MGARRLREAAHQVRRVPEPGVHPGEPTEVILDHLAGPARDRRLSPPSRRDLLVPRGRLRRGVLGGRRRGVRRDLPRRSALPVAVERSRSGNGAHVWFFFAEPVAAATRAPNGLLPHHRDDVPTAPAGDGVVRPALPEPGHDAARRLRQSDRPAAAARARAARQHASSSTTGLEPYADQWAYLAASRGSRAATVEAIAAGSGAHADRSSACGLRVDGEDEDDAPWKTPPSATITRRADRGPLPERGPRRARATRSSSRRRASRVRS